MKMHVAELFQLMDDEEFAKKASMVAEQIANEGE
jgi:hypothetical protein